MRDDSFFQCRRTRHGDKSGYRMSDLEDTEFYSKDLDLKMDAVFRSAIDTNLSLQLSTIWNWIHWLKTQF